ncbi:LysE family translocator [uncultured Nitratireductor sp.]|uniref:LysE family translocator n=1 Tax=uncultured Nitratireductor sp. TaxID=520953 RepID=UPI0025FFDF42|nr:LysE family translocator [uncultured Nitratireductor sp.]
MSMQLWLTFIIASLPVHFSPGPNNILALSRAIQNGYWAGHVGSLGRYPAYLMIFIAAGLGLGAVLSTSPVLFSALKWGGALYLVFMGYRLLRSAVTVSTLDAATGTVRMHALMRREFLVAIMNPKAVIFATAFYAQFITPGQAGFAHLFAQMIAVSLTLEWIAAGCYCLFGARIGSVASGTGFLSWITRGLGTLLIGFGVLLAAS